MKELLFLNIILCYLSVIANCSNDDFTCVAGNFTTGRPGKVTCYFGPDVHNKMYHFEIVRYPFNTPSGHSGEDVLRCHRLGNELRCATRKGFVFNEKIQDNLTISIPKVTVNQAGRYACQLIPPDDRKKRLCDLDVKEIEVASSICREDTSSETILVLTVLVGLLPPLCCLVILYLLCRKRTKKIRQKLPCFTRDRRPKSYKIHISPYNPADDEDGADESEEHNKYSGDKFDDEREPFKITILPYKEEDTRDTTDQIGSPPAVGQIRYPHRDPYHR